MGGLRKKRKSYKNQSMHTQTIFPRHRKMNSLIPAVWLVLLSLCSPGIVQAQTSAEQTDEMYAESVETIIMNRWQCPKQAAGKNLTCRVQIAISPVGKLKKSKLVKSSGMKLFDKSVLDAVASVSELPAPPETANPCEMILVFTSK
jgi:TonB family protein